MNRFAILPLAALAVAAVGCTSSEPVRLDAAALNDTESCPGVSYRSDFNGEPIVIISNAFGRCEVGLRGAHVLSCAFAGDEHPLLYVPDVGYRPLPGPRDFIHGGVPLLWPWFGGSGAPAESIGHFIRRTCLFGLGGAKEKWSPFHATARYSRFEVESATATAAGTSVTLLLRQCPEVEEWTPGDFELRYRITLGDHRLRLGLTTTNVGSGTFRYREGYHPYFQVSATTNVYLTGAQGCPYESEQELDGGKGDRICRMKVREQPGCDLFKFRNRPNVVTLEDPVWKRDITLTTSGAGDVVTWGQDVEGADGRGMNILRHEAPKYFCIEPSNYYAESETALEPGQSHTFATEITVTPRR